MAELRDIFPDCTDRYNYDHFLLTGIGSLMQYGVESKYNLVEAEDTSWQDGNNRNTKKSSRSVMKRYDRFIVDANDKFPFEVRFFFYYGAAEDDPTALAAIHLRRKVKSANNQVRIRIISMETMHDAQLRLEESANLFDLPLGYGCERKDSPGHEYEPPVELDTFASGQPVVLEFELVSHLPLSLKHDLDKWHTHSSFLRLVSGRLELDGGHSREYYMIQIQQHIRMETGQRSSSLRSRRRVWDLGEPETEPDARERQRQASRHYEVDEITGKCTGYGEAQFSETANLVLPMCLPSRSSSTRDAFADCASPVWAGLVLDQKQLKKLFADRDGYHLVRYSQDFFAWKSTYLYERRDERFTLYNSSGAIVWVGPVSIIRRHNKFQAGLSDAIRETFSPEDSKIRVTINLLTELKDQMIGRISISLLPVHIDQAQYHRELSQVSACFAQNQEADSAKLNSLSLFMPKVAPNRANEPLDFSVLYPVGDISGESVAVLARDGEFREQIYCQFVKSLAAVSSRRLDPLQFYGIEVEIDKEVIRISGALVEMSPLLAYKRIKGQRFSLSSKRLTLTEIKSSEAKCAESCHHFRCLKFTFCGGSNLCNLLMSDDVTAAAATQKGSMITFEPDENCDLFEHTYNGSSRRLPLSPLQFFHLYKQKLASRADAGKESSDELNLELVYEFNGLDEDERVVSFVFRPSTVEFWRRSDRIIEDLALDLSESKLDAEIPLESSLDNYKEEPPKLEYSLLLSDRKFKGNLAKSSADFPIKTANNIDAADQCETLCENNNCNSFAYCKIEKTCLISLLHRQEQIEPLSESAEFCSILVLNYLSKFERSLQISMPPKQATKETRAHSTHDCATYCMEESEFKCRAFDYCQAGVQTAPNCFLQKELHALRRDVATIASDLSPVELELGAPVWDCHSYLRK